MTCHHASSLLSAYLDRELPGVESLAVREHLRECPSCRAESEALASVKLVLGNLKVPEPTAGVEARLHRAVFVSNRRPSGQLAVMGLVALSSAAAAFLAIRLSTPVQQPVKPVATASHSELQRPADDAYIWGTDPLGGGVPAVTVGYAGGR